MALSNNKTTLDTLKRQADKDIRNAEEIKRQADQNIRNAEEIKRRVDEIIHKAEEKKKIEEENKKLEEEKKKIEEENKKIEEENKKLKEENKKLKEENKKLEEEANTKQKAQLATRTKTNTKKFDLYEISQEEELTQILEDHYAPVHGWVQGNLKEEYHGIETIFKTLKEAHDYYLETLKEKLEPSDVRYGGIIKATSGYKLMPNTHRAKSQTYKPHHNIKLKEWVYWQFDETCLE